MRITKNDCQKKGDDICRKLNKMKPKIKTYAGVVEAKWDYDCNRGITMCGGMQIVCPNNGRNDYDTYTWLCNIEKILDLLVK